MRLINTQTMKLETYYDDEKIPPYAILSHTWENEEVTFPEFVNDFPACRSKAGFVKIEYTCRQAEMDGYGFVWVDTVCIDKSSSAELSEAIQSMFAWYRKAKVCYAYLVDIGVQHAGLHVKDDFTQSRWFTRAWTLQELIAPRDVRFYNGEWVNIGRKNDLVDPIVERTGINRYALVPKDDDFLRRFNVAAKMSWAAERHATRKEDIAYCLLGIFDVNIPLLYGEGDRAFRRLQEEIIRLNDDQSLFAWNFMNDGFQNASLSANHPNMGKAVEELVQSSPKPFKMSKWMVNVPMLADRPAHSLTSQGIQIDLPILVPTNEMLLDGTSVPVFGKSGLHIGILSCRDGRDHSGHYIGVLLRETRRYDIYSELKKHAINIYVRTNHPTFKIPSEYLLQAHPQRILLVTPRHLSCAGARIYRSCKDLLNIQRSRRFMDRLELIKQPPQLDDQFETSETALGPSVVRIERWKRTSTDRFQTYSVPILFRSCEKFLVVEIYGSPQPQSPFSMQPETFLSMHTATVNHDINGNVVEIIRSNDDPREWCGPLVGTVTKRRLIDQVVYDVKLQFADEEDGVCFTSGGERIEERN